MVSLARVKYGKAQPPWQWHACSFMGSRERSVRMTDRRDCETQFFPATRAAPETRQSETHEMSCLKKAALLKVRDLLKEEAQRRGTPTYVVCSCPPAGQNMPPRSRRCCSSSRKQLLTQQQPHRQSYPIQHNSHQLRQSQQQATGHTKLSALTWCRERHTAMEDRSSGSRGTHDSGHLVLTRVIEGKRFAQRTRLWRSKG